jgi:dTDP-4-amino-4,6-dideoxygalactose transaminase
MTHSQHVVPFNRAYSVGTEDGYIREALLRGHLSGDGEFTRRCRERLEASTGALSVLLTTSCTSALEMAAMLLGCGPGDEIIMPSYTFVSTANAFVLRGATPVFVDIRADTLNLDERLVEPAICRR